MCYKVWSMEQHRDAPAVVIAALAFLSGISVGQSTPPGSPLSKSPSVTISFFVEDGHGNASAKSVAPADLSVLDKEKHQQTILSMRTAKDLPLRIGVLIDSSGSAGHSDLYGPAVQAAFDFLKQEMSGPDDKGFLVQFTDIAAATEFFTKDEISKLQVSLVTRGGTALYDAVNGACRERMKPDPVQPARRVLLILSDGEDNSSRITRNQAIAVAQAMNTVLFALNTGTFIENSKGRKVLEQMTDQTGGRLFDSMRTKDLPKIFASLGNLLDNMQSVTFVPSDPAQPREFRPIELKIATDSKLKIHAAKAYYGTDSTPPAP